MSVKGAGMKKKGYETRNVVLFPRQRVVVKRVMRELGLSERSGFSQAVRYIIDDWARMRSQRPEGLRQAAREAAFVLRQAAKNPSNDAENRIVYEGAAKALEKALGVGN